MVLALLETNKTRTQKVSKMEHGEKELSNIIMLEDGEVEQAMWSGLSLDP